MECPVCKLRDGVSVPFTRVSELIRHIEDEHPEARFVNEGFAIDTSALKSCSREVTNSNGATIKSFNNGVMYTIAAQLTNIQFNSKKKPEEVKDAYSAYLRWLMGSPLGGGSASE